MVEELHRQLNLKDVEVQQKDSEVSTLLMRIEDLERRLVALGVSSAIIIYKLWTRTQVLYMITIVSFSVYGQILKELAYLSVFVHLQNITLSEIALTRTKTQSLVTISK